MKTLLFIYHTMTGGTGQMVSTAVQGADSEAAVKTVVLPARDAQWEHVLAADGYVFATPENLGGISGLLKDFFDRTYYLGLGRLNGRPYGVMICAGSDGSGAVNQIARIATGWRLKLVTPPLVVLTHAQTAEAILGPKIIASEDLGRCRDLGQTFAAGLALGVY